MSELNEVLWDLCALEAPSNLIGPFIISISSAKRISYIYYGPMLLLTKGINRLFQERSDLEIPSYFSDTMAYWVPSMPYHIPVVFY